MVENHFLQRLNRLFQVALQNSEPFGGKQVIFLGDFHQLPPVKPFSHCLQCGWAIPITQKPACVSQDCITLQAIAEENEASKEQNALEWSDKWAFKASVWKALELRHIKLEQIHRQKDGRFQDILNKIRNGIPLSAEEWSDLERTKELPKGAYAVRLMSRLNQVKAFNNNQLNTLKSQPRTWRADDAVDKLIPKYYDTDSHKIPQYKKSLHDHRFPTELSLKFGARVVLLYNLDHERGLVNGSVGTVIGFAPAPQELEKSLELTSSHRKFRQQSHLRLHGLYPFIRAKA